ncbi:MAG TPA: hypothetical protein VGU46_11260 [Acidobacteriaceae bacterium]|nr:hypothetical protein [Acidobacteriaceae bacterium]
MKKVFLTSFLACVVSVSGLPSAFAQGASAAPAQATTTAGGQVQMPAAEYAVYNNANTQATPQAKAAAFEAYLTQFPQSAVKESVLEILMSQYSTFDAAKTLDAADRLLQVDPNNVRGLYAETLLRKTAADAQTDAAAKQAAMDVVATYAQKGLVAPKPKDSSDADFEKLKATQYPAFYSAIGYDAFLKKDSATAIDAYKKELAMVPVEQTKAPGTTLQDIFYLGYAYYQATPPDYLNCTFYATRAAVYAPEPYKTEFSKIAKYCYKKFHGADDGYDAVVASATANLNPPADFAGSVKPAPTPADIVTNVLATTQNLAALATGDKEYILQNGTPAQAAMVWDTIKGKSFEFPGALVLAVSPTQLQVAISDDAVQSKTADFTFNLKAAEATTKSAATPVVGQIVTLSGTYDSFTSTPLMITMSDGEIVPPKTGKAPARAAAKGPVHHRAAH